jgi:manganese efflux pump family protein
MLALLLVACSVGASNFAAAIAIGVSGVDAGIRLRVGLVFGVFEAGMPILGLALGAQLAGTLGQSGRWLAAIMLVAVGLYGLLSGAREPGTKKVTSARGSRLLLFGLVLSIDNLIVGFALGSTHTSIVTGAVVLGAVSVALSLVGLELGARIGARAGERGEQLAGLMMIAVGIAIGAGALS